MSLSIERRDDFVEAHEIADQRQILAIARLVRMKECSGHDSPQFGDVAHVNGTRIRIQRDGPSQRAVRLLLWPKSARQVLEIERGDDKRVGRKSGRLDD